MMRPTLAIDCFDIEVLPSLSIFWSTRIPGCADVGVHKMRTGRQSERWNAAHRRMDSRAAKAATFRPGLASNHNPDGLVASSATFSPETGPPPNLSLHSSSNGFVPALGFKAFKLLQQLISLCRKFGEAFDVAFSLQVTGLSETLGVLVLKFFQGFFDRLTDEGR